jgi:hypothetical protein
MNNRQNGRRRGRGGQQARNGQPGSPNNGNRIDNRSRGNAAQLLEKYKTLARDAQMQGDRVNTEYYLQFADHYFRVLSETRARFEEQRRPREDYRDEFGGDEEGGESQRGYGQRDEGQDDDWSGDDGVGTEQAPQPQYQPPRREERASEAGEGQSERRRERPRRSSPADRNAPAANGGNGFGSAPEFAGADAAPSRIEIDLPPSISAERGEPAGDGSEVAAEEAPKPRRRTRRPRAEAAPVDA